MSNLIIIKGSDTGACFREWRISWIIKELFDTDLLGIKKLLAL